MFEHLVVECIEANVFGRTQIGVIQVVIQDRRNRSEHGGYLLTNATVTNMFLYPEVERNSIQK